MKVKIKKRKRDKQNGTVFFKATEKAESGGGSCDGKRKERRVFWFERRFVDGGRWWLRDGGWRNIDGMMTWTKVLTLVVLLNWWCWVEIGRDTNAFFSDLDL